MSRVALYVTAAALAAGCSDAQTITSSKEPIQIIDPVASWALVQMNAIQGAVKRCSTLKATFYIGDASEEREQVLAPWLYDLLFPSNCEVRLLVDAPNIRIIPVRGGS